MNRHVSPLKTKSSREGRIRQDATQDWISQTEETASFKPIPIPLPVLLLLRRVCISLLIEQANFSSLHSRLIAAKTVVKVLAGRLRPLASVGTTLTTTITTSALRRRVVSHGRAGKATRRPGLGKVSRLATILRCRGC